MSPARSGPTGSAPLPPQWLAGSRLALTRYPAQTTFVRIHRHDRAAVFFSPGIGMPPTGRFDSTGGFFGVLYAALGFAGAFVETVLRNPARRLVGKAEIDQRSVCLVSVSRAISLVPLHGAGLQAIGLDNSITTGSYEPCGVWADALFSHPDQPDGIVYASRYDPEQFCVALFSRPDITVTLAGDSVRLSEREHDVAALLRRYGKGLDAG